jgi:hypothetical protein
MPEPWKQIFPPQICQVLLKVTVGEEVAFKTGQRC